MTLETTQHAIQRWHDMLKNQDMSVLNDLLDDEVVFRSPVAYQPYAGKAVVYFILTNVIQVFENFTYHREFFSRDGQHVVLEFSANIADKTLKGIDMIEFNEQGKIINFEVMIRPKSGLEALEKEMGKRFLAYQQ